MRAVALHAVTCPGLVTFSERNFKEFLESLSDSTTMKAKACLKDWQIRRLLAEQRPEACRHLTQHILYGEAQAADALSHH